MKKIIMVTRGIHIIEYIYPLIKKLSKDFKVYLVIKTNQYSLSGFICSSKHKPSKNML